MMAILRQDQAKSWVDSSLPTNDRLFLLSEISDYNLKAVHIDKIGEIDQYAQLLSYC